MSKKANLIDELLENIAGYGFYEGYCQGEYTALNADNERIDGEKAEEMFKAGKNITIIDDNDEDEAPRIIDHEIFFKALVQYEDKGYPEDIHDFTIDQLTDFNDAVQQFDYTTGAAVMDICFYGEVTYC